MVELNGVRIWAVALPVESGLVAPPRKLVCGTLARPLDRVGGRPRLPELPGWLAVPGRSDVAVAWTGWFELMTGEVVGVYGAQVEGVGGGEVENEKFRG